MADVLDLFSGLTLNTQEATQESDLIKVNPYFNPEVTNVHGVQTGVIVDKYIPILGQFEDIGKLDPGSCSVNAFEDAIPVSEKKWEPKLMSSRITLCADDIPQKFKVWTEAMIAANRWESFSDPAKQFILDRAQQAVSRAIIRISDFADKLADVVGSGGNMTAGTTIELFTMLDGMWKQIFTDGALGTPLIYRYTIAENSAGTKSDQLNLAEDAAYQVMMSMVENMPPEAMNGNNVFQITKSLWDNWVRYLQKISGAYRPELLQDGMTKETFFGYRLIVRKDWDRIIKKYHDLGTTFYLPHRALLTDINNVPIGTSDTQSFSTINAFYDKTDKKHYTDVAWREDCKLLMEDSIVVAY